MTDLRGLYNSGIKKIFGNFYKNIYPFKNLFNEQVKNTEHFFELYLHELGKNLSNDKDNFLLDSSLKLPDETLRGGCRLYCNIGGDKISVDYLNNLNNLKLISKNLTLSKVKNYFEIGGGYGAFTHCLLTNFTNIRKVIYLDIPPNLYIGTQYLRSFFGDAVKDYSETCNLKTIKFEENDALEIFCIAPMQIEALDCKINYFHNSSSFVEMPEKIVKNYGKHISRVLDNEGVISLISYTDFREGVTLNPKNLSEILGLKGNFNTTQYEDILSSKRVLITTSS
jgi:putative sugar O-methyltransferase